MVLGALYEAGKLLCAAREYEAALEHFEQTAEASPPELLRIRPFLLTRPELVRYYTYYTYFAH